MPFDNVVGLSSFQVNPFTSYAGNFILRHWEPHQSVSGLMVVIQGALAALLADVIPTVRDSKFS
jgi:hypothetical protein